MRTYLIYLHIYCESPLGESNLRWHKKTIILKNNFKLQIELIMKTDKNTVVEYRSEFTIRTQNVVYH